MERFTSFYTRSVREKLVWKSETSVTPQNAENPS